MDFKMLYTKLKKYIVSVNWMELIYLTLFAAFVIGKFLETTALQWSLPSDYNMIIRVLLCIFIQISLINLYVSSGKVNWVELGFMIIMVSVAYMVSYHVNEIFIFDTMLFVIGAKNIDYKKICFVYICIAVTLLCFAMYLSGKGYIADYIYQSERGVRHSLGICYPTDFMAHIFFLFAVYICYRSDKLMFSEIVLMLVIGLTAYHWTYARNSTICVLVLCFMCLIIKILRLLRIRLTDYKWMNLLSLVIIIAFIIWIVLMTQYNEGSSFFAKLNDLLSNRIQLSAQGYQTYGISLYGNVIQENGLAFGGFSVAQQYFFLDVFFVRVLIKYGFLLSIVISVMFIRIFTKMRIHRKDYMLAVLLAIIIFGMTDYQVLYIAYNPIWLFVFANFRRGQK